jgi:cardiolipin synthase
MNLLMPSWLNLPNSLTLFRLASAPFVAAAIAGGHYYPAAVLFLLAAITDSFDGMLARRMGATTKLGGLLDPVTDKVFLSAVFLALAIRGDAPLWYVAIVFARDALILLFAAAALLFTSYRRFVPSVWGKLSTFLQIAAATSLVVRGAWPAPSLKAFADAAVCLSAAATVWSGVHYAWRAWRS